MILLLTFLECSLTRRGKGPEVAQEDRKRLLVVGVPEFERPEWVRRDRMPLTHPGELLSDEPAAAFADRNDLRFMESLSRSRPRLVRLARVTLEMTIERKLVKKPRQFRIGAGYSETEEDLPSFARPDLLKAILLLQELERPEVVEMLMGWVERDVAELDVAARGEAERDEAHRRRRQRSGLHPQLHR